MATTPPNPFYPQEVQKYLDRKDAAEVTKSRRAEELADEDNNPAVGPSSPAEQARDMRGRARRVDMTYSIRRCTCGRTTRVLSLSVKLLPAMGRRR